LVTLSITTDCPVVGCTYLVAELALFTKLTASKVLPFVTASVICSAVQPLLDNCPAHLASVLKAP